MRLRSAAAWPPHPGRCLLVVAAGAAVLACAPEPGPEPQALPASMAESTAVALPSLAEFVSQGLAVAADSRAELRELLGEPDSVAEEEVPNRHVPGVMDTIYTLHYPDLVARIHHPGGGGDLMSMLQVSSNVYLRYAILGLGVAAVDGGFGSLDEASDSSLTYYCTSCVAGNDPVEIVFVEGEARRVRFNYYVD